LITWSSIKIRKLHVKGCMTAGAVNFNPEATEDDGSCQATNVVRLTGPSAVKVGIAASQVIFSIPTAGRYTARLSDVNGVFAGKAEGIGPFTGSMALQHPGIYFMEVTSAGILSRHRVENF
jgi:hypothetical protein